jgi:hypothetical protein
MENIFETEEDWLERNAAALHELFSDWIESNAAENFAATQEALGYTATRRAIDEQPSRPPRARKPSLTSRLKAAQKAGAKDVDVRPDGTVSAVFGTEPIPNEWDTDLGIDKPRGH